MNATSRRRFVRTVTIAGLGAFPVFAVSATAPPGSSASPPPPPAPLPVPDEFPTQSAALAREMVGVSHANPGRVRELLALHPTLANAAWDWGFGDWETALGAASHMGNVEIARMLLASGARPTIFSAAMLGQLAVVRAFVETSPGVQGTPGPHGITLLAHATAGGASAKPVLDYLVAVGGADPVPKSVDLTPEAAARYAGVYAFGARDVDRIEISYEKGMVRLKRVGTSARNLVSLGDHAFHPAGAPVVRIRFTMAEEVATDLTVHDPDVVLRARRVG